MSLRGCSAVRAGCSWHYHLSSSADSKLRAKRVTFAENCLQDDDEDNGKEIGAEMKAAAMLEVSC